MSWEDDGLESIIEYEVPYKHEGCVCYKTRQAYIDDYLVDAYSDAMWFLTEYGDLVKETDVRFIENNSVERWVKFYELETHPEKLAGCEVASAYVAYAYFCEKELKDKYVSMETFQDKACVLIGLRCVHRELVDEDYFENNFDKEDDE